MTNLNLLKKNGGSPILIPDDTVDLTITDPVSDLVNFGEVVKSLNRLERLSLYVSDLGKTDLSKSLDFLRGAKKIKFLSIGGMKNLQDCTALAECKSLEWLIVARYVPFDYNILPLIPSLRRLRVELIKNTDLNLIARAFKITSLEVLGGFKLSSLTGLTGLANLENLRLWSGHLDSTSGLSAFDRLQTLDVGYSKLRDTSELGSLKSLTKMELIGNKAITNIDFLQPGNLEFLGMFEVPQLESLKPILRLPKLKEFRSDAKVLDGDILPLINAPALEKAFISRQYKTTIKKIRAECRCVFRVGKETLKVTKQGPTMIETASQARERLSKKLGIQT